MKKLLMLGLSLITTSIALQAVDATVTLAPNFLKYDGTYKFDLDIKARAIDKVWNVIVKDGKATLKHVKGIKGKNIEIKGNVISAKMGILEAREAQDLEIQALEGSLKGQYTTMVPRQDTKKFTVDVGPGLTIQYVELERSKPLEDFSYILQIGSNLPDGSYTAQLLRPAAKDKTFHFEVKNQKIINLSGDKEGKLVDGSIKIAAKQMCATRKAKQAVAIGGGAIAAIIATAVTGGAAYAIAAAPAGAAAIAGSTATYIAAHMGLSSAAIISAGSAATAATTGAITVAGAAIIPATVAGSIAEAANVPQDDIYKLAKAIAEGKTFGGTVMGAIFGFRESTLQVECHSGKLARKAVKIFYEECRKNIWELNAIDNKILIMGE